MKLALSRLYIDQSVKHHAMVREIRLRLKIPTEVVPDANHVYALLSARQDPVKRGKQVLFLTRNNGAFIRQCPGTRHYTCCDYMILHIGSYCLMDCSYCILQAYFHPPLLQYFVNHDDMAAEIEHLFSGRQTIRIGTGEFTDSLIWEPWTDLSDWLIPKFSKQQRAVLELKTKTAHVRGLKHLEHNRKTILAWSLNSERIVREEERGTAPLNSRLKAAASCEKWGYPLAFHFDPLVIYEGCEADYRKVLEKLFARVSADRIVWISLGAFRFMPDLKGMIQKRFPSSRIVYGEFVPGLDGKMRYFKPLRIELYKKMVGWIREMAPNLLVYLCMEDDEVWRRALGFVPADYGGLGAMLDESARKHCGLSIK